MDKLLISVLGNRNSGKSYTWNSLFGAVVRTGKEERWLKFDTGEYVKVFLVSGSPEERETYVGDLMTVEEPRIVLCSTQYTENVRETFNYFIEKGYFLFVHWLNPGYHGPDAMHIDNLGLISWLQTQQSLIGIRSGKSVPNSRVREIKDYIYSWAKSRNLLVT